MQKIILCPKCHVQVKKDNLGELLCPSCGARLCPKAHVFDGKICPYCGWEDPNYHLWQKSRERSFVSRKQKDPLDDKPQYMCPRCYTQVNTPRGVCPNQRGCGYSGPMRRRDVQKPAVSAAPTPVSKTADITSRSHKSASLAPSKASVAPPRSPILSEIAKAERREWKFSPPKRFIRPVLASLLVAIVLGGLATGGYYGYKFILEVLGQSGREQSSTPISTSTVEGYTLRAIVSQEGGGKIGIEKIEPSSTNSEQYQTGVEITLSSVEPGSQVTLTAIPYDRYIFDQWEGVTGSSGTIIVTMDSNKSVTAYFKLKDTTPPEIFGIEVSNVTELCATITWGTDDLATGQVEYGKRDVHGLITPPDEKLATSHHIRLTGLESNTVYHFRVVSKNASQLQATSAERTFKTIYPQPAKVGNLAPDFALPQMGDNSMVVLGDFRGPDSALPQMGDNSMVILSDFRGKKVLLNLWATACTGCVLELPYIQDVHVKYQDLAVITVCLDKDVERIYNFIEKHPELTFPILVNQPSITKGGYNIRLMPTTFFIDSDGIIREIKSGTFGSSEQIEEAIKSID